MEQIRAGFVLALATAREQLRLFPLYWQAIKPWGYVYMAIGFVYQFFYPKGHDSYILGMLWALLFMALILNMAWNWANALVGSAARLTWDKGWDNPDYRDYVSGLMVVLLGMPVAIGFVVGFPAALILTTLSAADESQIATTLTTVVFSFVFYVMARLLPMSAALVARTASPLPVIWKRSESRQVLMVSALLVAGLANAAIALVIVFAGALLDSLGVPRADMLIMPAALLLGIFMAGWLVLLSQRLFGQIEAGR